MNNEVLRRKMFRTVLADSRAPAGILASSPEMVRTVQKRVGGAQAGSYELNLIPELVQRGDVRALQALTAPSYPKQVRLAASQALGAATVDKRPAVDLSDLQGMPDESSGLTIAGEQPTSLPFGIERLFTVGDPARPKGLRLGPEIDDVSIQPRVRSPFTPGPIAEGNTEEEQLDDEYVGISDQITPVSGPDTQSTMGTGRKVSTVPPTAADIANQVDQALSGNRDQSSESRALGTARQEFEAGADKAILGLETKLSDLNAAMLSGNIDAQNRLVKAEGDVRTATDAYNKALEKGFVEAKEFTLEDVKDEALKLSGIEKENYDEDRKNALWFNIIRAGLAVAAGESENTLTNLAKGLGFGLEGYGKDIGTINSQEREDRKELRNLQLQLINNKNSRELALAAAENDFNYNQQRLAQAQKEGADTRLLQAQAQADTSKLALQRLDVETAFQISSLTTQKEKALLDFDQQIAQMDQKDRQLAEQRAFDQWKANLATVPDEFWDVVGMGANYAVKDDDGNWNLTEEGEKYYKRLINASLTTGTKVTDLQRDISNVANGVSIQGVPLGQGDASRLGAASIWVSGYRDEFEKAEQYQKRSILERYIKDAAPYLDPDMPLNILDTIFPPN